MADATEEPITSKEVSAVSNAMDEIFGANDRSAAIVALAFIEDDLTRSIRRKLVFLSSAQDKRLFSGARAPLGSLSARLLIAHALGLISNVALRDLETMKDIRNEFAHNMDARTFTHPAVAKLCARLNAPIHRAKIANNEVSDDPGVLFRSAVIYFLIQLMRLRSEENRRDRNLFETDKASPGGVLAGVLARTTGRISYPDYLANATREPSPKRVRVRPSRLSGDPRHSRPK